MTVPPSEKRRIEVLHLCEDARQLADVIDLQVVAGIRPYLLTNPAASGSNRWWMQAWNDVREWRRLLAGFSIPLIHAHTFSAGMAAVRGESATVYQVADLVERQLAGPGSSWMQRSFRAAEHFVFAQTQAIIVRSAVMRHALTSAGVEPAKIFLVPETVPVLGEAEDIRIRVEASPQALTVLCETANTAVQKAVALCSERKELRFQVRAANGTSLPIPGCEPLENGAFEAARRRADIIIAADEDAVASAMASGTAVLAADTVFLRELSPNGEGCLWFASGEELASKLVFLAENARFRDSLAAAGRRYILGERNEERVGKLYLKVYQYALERRRSSSGPVDLTPSLIPVRVV
jgi:hypothetical protein